MLTAILYNMIQPNPEGRKLMSERNFVTYEEFGAVGDGIHDDMPAIVACHEYANANGLDVVGTDGANYYIGSRDLTAVIKTNVRWGTAKFTIDDRELENIYSSCFRVASDALRFEPKIKTLQSGQKHIDFPHEENLYVRVFDESTKRYIRRGANQNNGVTSSDCFTVDREGNVTGDINWDYASITKAYAFSTEDAPITIEGGVFETIANIAPSFYNYHGRNIQVSRSHTTLQGITHLVTGEEDHGAPYRGFLSISECCDITIKDCLLTAHKTYFTESKIPGVPVPMGSYDINVDAVIDIRLLNIKQTTDITDSKYWGLMGSNFAKNFYLENCEISRFDAHMGVTNCTIKGCTFGHMGVNLIGFGEALIENTTFRCHRMINFRPDYGSFFHGKLTLRNCVWKPTVRPSEKAAAKNGPIKMCLLAAENDGFHDFGYVCGMPKTIEIDGIEIDDAHCAEELCYVIFSNYNSRRWQEEQPYPYSTPENVTVKRLCSKKGSSIIPFAIPEQYPHIQDLMLS